MGKTEIEWTDATWNPVVGCSIVSKGCTNCYAMRTAGARTKHTAKYFNLTQSSKAGPVWTGEVRFWEKALTEPLHWREPRRVFVNSMGDLFHEDVPAEWIDRCFAVMALCNSLPSRSPAHAGSSPLAHTFQILTKRPERMRDYFSRGRAVYILDAMHAIVGSAPLGLQIEMVNGALPNVWLGVSAEDQATAEARVPILLDTPAAVRFISLEPLLGPIDLRSFLELGGSDTDLGLSNPGLDQVIVGGESGKGARPMHPDWARSLRDQVLAAKVALVGEGTAGLSLRPSFFFKQWGEWLPAAQDHNEIISYGGHKMHVFDEVCQAYRVGKHAAGRLLDGRTWDEYPEAVR